MVKLTLTDLTQLSSNETSAVNAINANGALIETAMENTLSRDGTTPNTMSADIDMNSNKLLNVAAGTAAADGVNLAQLTAATGQVPGLSMTMETTTTDVDQGAGKVWFNAAVASATVLYMDDADTNSADISTFVQTWDSSTTSASRGLIYVIQKASAVNYALFEIDGAITDASGYSKIPVNYIVGAGTLADTDPVTVNFLRTGDTGATGPTGATGATGPTGAAGDIYVGVVAKTQADDGYTVVLGDKDYLHTWDVSGGSSTVNLTAAATLGDGYAISLKKIDSSANTLTIDADGAETIDGSATLVLSDQYEATTLVCDGSNWHKAVVTSSGGGGWLGESGASGSSADIFRVNEQTLNTNNTISATDNASATGPLSIASGVTLTVEAGATFVVI